MAPRRKKVLRVQPTRRKRTPTDETTSLLDLVRQGVERFVLKDANMMSFQKTIRAASKKGETSSHPLTGAAFRRIVKQAIHERKRRIRRGLREMRDTDD